MPKKWQENFENANLMEKTTTIQQIQSYMQKQSLKNPFVPKTPANNHSGNQANKKIPNNRNAQGVGKDAKDNNKSNKNNKNQQKKKFKNNSNKQAAKIKQD